LPHLGQSVLFVVSITFLRSAVLAILAIGSPSFWLWIYFTLCGALSTQCFNLGCQRGFIEILTLYPPIRGRMMGAI
jgi:hypothetical protein